MQFDFDEVIDRRGTSAMAKEGFRPYLFGGQAPVTLPCADEDALSMWVADMAFASVPAAREAMIERIEGHPILGYTGLFGDELYDVFAAWCESRYDWRPERDHLVVARGIVPALYAFAEIYLAPGQKALTVTPAYGYFGRAPEAAGCEMVSTALLPDADGVHRVDLGDFAAKVADPAVTMFYLCHPHNPTGRVFTETELRQMGELCAENDVLIISDEIHCDLLRAGLQHTPMARVMADYDQVITGMAASKTFNLAGLSFAQIVIPNAELRQRWHDHAHGILNPVSMAATIGAFRDGSEWLDQLVAYLDANFAHLHERLANELPDATFTIPEATYLAWIDMRSYFPAEMNLTRYFAEAAGLLLEGGDMFISDGDGWLRLNLACPKAVLDDGISRLVEATSRYAGNVK